MRARPYLLEVDPSPSYGRMLEEPRTFATLRSTGLPNLLGLRSATGTESPLDFESLGVMHADFVVRRSTGGRIRRVSPLSTWRLKRVTDYIDDHLGQPIHLAHLSEVAGLSRMYFAAQFKTATGMAPHAYVLRRRIRLAQSLLLGRNHSIQSIALRVGFKGPAHFVEVFHRLVGESPGRWRELIAECHSELFGRQDGSLWTDEANPWNVVRSPSAQESALLPKRLMRTLDYIDGNLARPLRLAELSALSGLSKMHFSAQFRRATGLPPYAYILRRRIMRGQQLLLETEDTTVNIALALGFTSQAHFTTAFKKIVGATPARWRREQMAGRQ